MLELLLAAGMVVIDQLVKFWAARELAAPGRSVPVIKNVFEIVYTQNTGAAFGMLGNMTVILSILSIVLTLAMIAYLVMKRKDMPPLLRATLALLIAGAAGNAIDRALLGYVRDMFYFKLINFAVFNVADACITIGGVMLVICVIWMDKKSAAKPNETQAAQLTPEEEQ